MSRRVRVRLVGAVLLVLAGTLTWAQSREVQPLSEPKILSGSDIGFRIEGMSGRRPVGQLVIRVDGRWVEPETARKVIATTR